MPHWLSCTAGRFSLMKLLSDFSTLDCHFFPQTCKLRLLWSYYGQSLAGIKMSLGDPFVNHFGSRSIVYAPGKKLSPGTIFVNIATCHRLKTGQGDSPARLRQW